MTLPLPFSIIVKIRSKSGYIHTNRNPPHYEDSPMASENIRRNIVLITASELIELALEWGSDANTEKDETFSLGMLARPDKV